MRPPPTNMQRSQSAAADTAAPSKEQQLEAYVEQHLRREHYAVGPHLKQIRAEQEQMGAREMYTVEHLRRLLKHEYKRQFVASSKVYCSKMHGPGCQDCYSCHFCRQKTVDLKTQCCCEGRRDQAGGPRRGIWCGGCLMARMGENIEEVLRQPDWRCPACRGICNCSAHNCQRARRGLRVTDQLVHEATSLGFKSVAHYLILTHLDDTGVVAPMPAFNAAAPRHQHQRLPVSAAAAAGAAEDTLWQQQQQQQTKAAAAAAAAAAARRERARKRRQEETRRLHAACSRELAMPLEEASAALAERGIGMSILDTDMYDHGDDELLQQDPNTASKGLMEVLAEPLRTLHMQHQQLWQQQDVWGSPTSDSSSNKSGRLTCMLPLDQGILGLDDEIEGLPSMLLSPPTAMQQTAAMPSPAFAGTAAGAVMHHQPAGTAGCLSNAWTGGQGRSGCLEPSTTAGHSGSSALAPPPAAVAAAAAATAVAGFSSRGAVGTGTSHAADMEVLMAQHKATYPSPKQPLMPQQQHKQRQQQHQLQQQHLGQQQCRDQPVSAAQQQPASAAQQQRLQQFQALDNDFGPADVPGADAPGYQSNAELMRSPQPRHRPLSVPSVALHGTASLHSMLPPNGYRTGFRNVPCRQPKLTSWLSRAANAARPPRATADSAAAEAPAAGSRAAAEAAANHVGRSCSTAGHTALGAGTAGLPTPGIRDTPVPAVVVGVAGSPEHVNEQQAAAGSAMPGRSAVAAAATSAAAAAAPGERRYADTAAANGRTSCAEVQLDAADVQTTALQRYLRHLCHAETPLVYLTRSRGADAECELTLEEQLGRSAALRRSQQLLQQKCSKILNQAFTNNSMWDEGDVTINCYSDSPCKYTHDTLCTAAELLLLLGRLLPLDMEGSSEGAGGSVLDVIRRLRGLDAFLNFQASDPKARSIIIMKTLSLLDILNQRASADTIMAAAEAAAASAATAGASPPEAAAAAIKAARSALQDAGHAVRGMCDLSEQLLDWLGLLRVELVQLYEWLRSPKDLLGPLHIGPLKWSSARSEAQQASASFLHRQQQQQQQLEQQATIDERCLHLKGLVDMDGTIITLCCKHLGAAAAFVPKAVALGLLQHKELAALLALDLPLLEETRSSVLTAISALITQAAPDLHNHERWLLEDSQRILQLLQQQHDQLMSVTTAQLACRHQQQQQQHDNLVQHTIQQLHRLLFETTQQPEERLAAVQQVAAAVQMGMLAHIERLVAGEYILRERWLADTYKQQQQQQQQNEQQQQQHMPWFAAVQADAAAGSKEVNLRLQQWQQDHCLKLKTSKAETLAVVYGLQLQAGCVTWQQMEQQLTAPAGSLDRLLLHYKSPMLRKLVLYVCAQMALVAPSLLWQQQQQQQQQQQTGLHPGAQAAPSAATPFPSDWLLRLWLRGNFDCTNSGTRMVLWHATKVLSNNAATMSLFSGLPLTIDVAQQLSLPHHCGIVCATMLRVVCRRVAAAGGPQRLLELLRGLDQALRMREAELDSQYQRQQLLTWQYNSIRGLMGIAEIISEQLFMCRPEASCVRSLQHLLQQLMATAARWQSQALLQLLTCAGPGLSGGVVAEQEQLQSGEAALDILQQVKFTALKSLKLYLALVISLAGKGSSPDGVNTDNWPLGSGFSGGSSLQQAWAAAPLQQQQQQQQRAQVAARHQQQLQPRVPAGLEFPCLKELLAVLLDHLSAADQLSQHQQAGLLFVTQMLLSVSGLPGAAEAGDQHQQQQPDSCLYQSAGLLHQLLGTHLRLVLEASADMGLPATHTRAVNALHLLKALFDQPHLQQLKSLQLLLPCLARPLVQLLAAPSQTRCPAAQLQALQLLEKLLCGPCREQLLPPPSTSQQAAGAGGEAAAGGAGVITFSSGPLRSQSPVSEQQLQRLMEHLLRAGLQASLSAVAGVLPQDAADRAVTAVKEWQQKKQCQWQLNGGAAAVSAFSEVVLPWQASAVPAAASITSALFSVTGPPPEVPASLKHWAAQGWQAIRPGIPGAAGPAASALGEQLKGPTASMAAAAVHAGAARPDDFCNLLAVAAVRFCKRMAQLGGFAQEQVLQAMPCLCLLLQKGRQHCTQQLMEAYEQLRQEMPEQRRHGLRLRDIQMKPPVVPGKQTQQQQQQSLCQPPGMPPAQQPLQQPQRQSQQQQQQQRQRQQQQQQQQLQRQPQRQQQQGQGPRPAASHASCAVPRPPSAAALAGGRLLHDCQQQQHQATGTLASPAEGAAKRRRIEVPQASQGFSQQGGRAASCAVVTQTQAQQQQQQQQQAAEEPPRQHQQQMASAAEDSDGDECTSSRLCRKNPDPKPQQQGRQQAQPPDTRSQDQGAEHQRPCADTTGQHLAVPQVLPRKSPQGPAAGSRELVGLVVNCKKINSADILAYKLELRVRDSSHVQLALSDGWAKRACQLESCGQLRKGAVVGITGVQQSEVNHKIYLFTSKSVMCVAGKCWTSDDAQLSPAGATPAASLADCAAYLLRLVQQHAAFVLQHRQHSHHKQQGQEQQAGAKSQLQTQQQPDHSELGEDQVTRPAAGRLGPGPHQGNSADVHVDVVGRSVLSEIQSDQPEPVVAAAFDSACVGAQRHSQAVLAASSMLQDSQATIKYLTLPGLR